MEESYNIWTALTSSMCVSCWATVNGSLQMDSMSLWMAAWGFALRAVSRSAAVALILTSASSYWLSTVNLLIRPWLIWPTAFL